VASPPKEPRSRPRFTELELDDTSLLNTIAAVAEAVANEGGPGGEEETVFSVSDGLDPDESPASDALPHIPLFSDLPPEAFIELFERCPLRRVRSGQRIIQQGSYGDAFFVICEGAVRIVREDAGQTRELATLESGAFFGEVALLSDAPRTASVDSASDDTQVLEISAPVLTELSHTYPTVARALKKFCRERLLRTLMSTSALFRAFGKSDRRKLLERFRARDVARGHVLVREGQESDGLYVLLSGEVAVVRGEQLLATLKEGDLFGEMSLLEKTPASATVSATRRTSLLRLPRGDFDALILTHPQALMHLAELSDARRKQTDVLLGRTGEAGEATLMLV
jgi:CRP-like cAMP-binding protein